MLDPGLAPVWNKSSPTEQVAGSALPDFSGLVEVAPEKSIDFPCDRRSTLVWAIVTAMPDASIQPSSVTRGFIRDQDLWRRSPRSCSDFREGSYGEKRSNNRKPLNANFTNILERSECLGM